MRTKQLLSEEFCTWKQLVCSVNLEFAQNSLDGLPSPMSRLQTPLSSSLLISASTPRGFLSVHASPELFGPGSRALRASRRAKMGVERMVSAPSVSGVYAGCRVSDVGFGFGFAYIMQFRCSIKERSASVILYVLLSCHVACTLIPLRCFPTGTQFSGPRLSSLKRQYRLLHI